MTKIKELEEEIKYLQDKYDNKSKNYEDLLESFQKLENKLKIISNFEITLIKENEKYRDFVTEKLFTRHIIQLIGFIILAVVIWIKL